MVNFKAYSRSKRVHSMRFVKVAFGIVMMIWVTAAASEKVTIGVLAFRSKADTLKEWTPTAEYLTRAIPGYTFQILPLDYPQMRDAAANETVDFIITNSGHYVLLESKYHVSRIATMMKYKKGEWLKEFGSVIFTRADRSDINQPQDVAGHTVAAVDEDSLGGYSAPIYELEKNGVHKNDYILHFTGMPHGKVVQAVLRKEADVGFVRSEVLEDLAAKNELDLNQVKIIHPLKIKDFPYMLSTALYPEWPIARMEHTSLDLADKVVVALLSKSRRNNPQEGEIGWTAPLEYRKIHQVFEVLRLPPYDQPERFDLIDIYHRYKYFIIALAALGIVIVIGMIREFSLRRRLQQALAEQMELDERLEYASRKNEMLLRFAGDGVHILDMEGNIVQVSDTFCRMLGYTREEMIGMNVSTWEAAIPIDEILSGMRQIHGFSKIVQTKHRRKDNSVYDAEINVSVVVIGDEKLVYCSARDITERIINDAQTQLAAMVYESSTDPISITDADAMIISVNPAFEAMTGYMLEELNDKRSNFLQSGYHSAEFYRIMWDAINAGGFWEGEIVDRNKEGQIFSKWLTIRTVYDSNGAPYRRIALFSEVSDQKEAQQKIWYQANFDALTALPNRSLFLFRLAKGLQESIHSGLPIALLFLDIDHFKEVNDTMGHEYGDKLLQEAARRISHCVDKSDVVSRIGGDEFTIIVSKVEDNHQLDSLSQTLLAELARPFDLDERQVFVSASIGITVAPNDGNQTETLLRNAEQAMYESKKEGRNRYRFFTSSMEEMIQKRMHLTAQMRDAIESNQFVLFYQPIIDVKTGEVYKAEALIRWKKRDGSMISPADFIPIAEDTGLIIEIGDWVLNEALMQVKRWREKYDPRFQISINKSPVQFRNENSRIFEWIESIHNLSVGADAMVIEITEGMLMEQTPIVRQKLIAFQERGILLSLDDFGTGYSSLSYLKKFDIDFLKIDQTFIRNLETDQNDRILCEAVVAMSHKLGISVIAEGVETLWQHDFLKSVECDFIQGYYISHPLPVEEFERRFLTEKKNTSV